MAYRYQATMVGWWRGKIKRWNVTFHHNANTLTANIYTLLQRSGWPNSGDVVGACSGGVASISVYAGTGGAPVSRTIYFDWETPTTWIPYTGENWAGVDPLTPLDASGESALVVVGNMPGLSSSGKPVTTRKYLHAIPSRTAAAFADPDVPAAVVTAMKAQWNATYLCNPAGAAPSSTDVEEWYGNHQRVRGRRRTATQVAAQAFSGGVVMGTSACASGGGGRPAQFQ